MTKPDVYLWRDAVDKNQFWIGIKLGESSYCAWLPVFCDAITECFGKEAYAMARELKPSLPVRIKLELAFPV